MKKLKKAFTLLVALAIAYLLLAALELDHLLFDLTRSHGELLTAWVSAHWLLASLLMVGLYVLLLSLAMPLGIILTVIAGFLFGAIWGSVLIWIGAMMSAWLVFSMARGILSRPIQRHFKNPIRRLTPEFEENGLYYLLALRLSYILPYFMVNLTLGSLPIRKNLYLLTTAVGLIPGTVLYAWLGESLGEIDRFADLVTARMFVIFVLIGILALLPVAIKKYRR